MTLWLRGLIRSQCKQKSLCLQHYSAYAHQTWQDGNLFSWAPAHKVISLSDHVIFWNHVATKTPYISTTTVFMATKRSMLTYHEGLPPIIYTPPCLVRSHDKLKTLYLHYYNAYGHKTWQDDVLPWVTSTHKVTWPFNHLVL